MSFVPDTARTAGARNAGATSASPFLALPPDRAARLRLYCFHHAGGGASAFGDWRDALGPRVVVQPIQLPGRERRVQEPRFTDMAQLTRELDEQLDPYLDQPYAIYGHSMGALVAWHLLLRRRAGGRRLPEALLVGACTPPHLPPISATVYGKSHDELVAWMQGMGGISPMVLKYPEWVDAAVSLLRDDLALCNSHPHAEQRDKPPAPLPIPIYGFAGAADEAVNADLLEQWGRYSAVGSQVFEVGGGHLFFRESPTHFISLLRSVLDRIGDSAAAASGAARRA
ncbi:MAG TPA: alpha/beta fold hydrolase [Actinocrinis sp.]|nr:alpha/beta fold hydrolase [Actinocrinis sp.]